MLDATRAMRCLTILIELTSLDLLVQLWPCAWKIARRVAHFRRAERSPEAMHRFESELQDLLREVGRVIVQWTINHLEDDLRRPMPAMFFWDSDPFRWKKRKSPTRKLNCLFGPIVLLRYYYQPTERSGRGLFPLELHLGIVAGVATPALADLVGQLAADLTQRQTLSRLRQQGVVWGARTLRKVTAAMAESMSEHRHEAQVQKVLQWLSVAAASKGPRRLVLSVGRDGVMIPVVKSQRYKEAATATVSVMDRFGRRLGTVYLGQMPEAHQITLSKQLTALLTDVLARWEGPLPRLVYVTDCGHHPTEYFEHVLAKMLHPRTGESLEWEWVVDYYHACQYITQLGEAIFGKGREATAWAAKQRRVLKTKAGGVFRVLRSAGALEFRRGLLDEDAYRTAYSFLRNRASKMNYRTYRFLKMPIGSGITEAGCKIVFTQRFKQSGMKWGLEGGRWILSLRVLRLSGVWNEVRQLQLQHQHLPRPVSPNRLTDSTSKNSLQTAV
jgi:hypothetical protein